jgi:hypothetical protein
VPSSDVVAGLSPGHLLFLGLPPHDVISRAAIPLACLGNSPYLRPMVQPISTRQGTMATARPQSGVAAMIAPVIAWGAAGLGALVVLGAAALWFHYGTAVFFEMIASGISACF